MIEGHLTDPVKLDKYNVIHYLSTKIGITEEELIEEAKQYWANYNPNGISGSLVILAIYLLNQLILLDLLMCVNLKRMGIIMWSRSILHLV